MKTVSPALVNAIREEYVLYAKPRLIADWNMNRYGSPVASNTPDEESEGYDVEMFPIESIIAPIRPTKGVCKARIGQSVVGDDYGAANKSASARYYISDVDDVYKYWNAPYLSDGSGNITGASPQVVYGVSVAVNKIVIKLENSWASPIQFTVQTTTDGNSWTTVATNPTIRNDGQVILYFNGGSWSAARPSDLSSTQTIRGVKLNVTRLGAGKDGQGNVTTYDVRNVDGIGYTRLATNGADSNFNLIAIEAHREVDLSEYVISTTDTFDTSDVSMLYPIGTITANVGEVTLSNVDGTFNNENPNSPFFSILRPNVEFNLEYLYDLDNDGVFEEAVQQFKMYTSLWSGQRDDTVTVPVVDASTYLQESVPRAAMWEGLTVPEIIWRILDSIGFVDYEIDLDDRVVQHTIPVFWCDGVQNAWEILGELAKSTQSAIYFDAHGTLQVKTRDTAFDDAKSSAWTIRADNSGTELADLASFSQTDEFNANHVTVTYKETKWSDYNNGQPALQKVWEPDGTVTLRAAELITSLGTSDNYFWLGADKAIYWPYSGKVNIQSEIIAYNAKHYVYYSGPSGSTRNTVDLTSDDDKKKYDSITPVDYRYKNHFTGGMRISERGAWNSEIRTHHVEANGYSVRNLIDGSQRTDAPGFHFHRRDSVVTLNSPGKFDGNDLLLVTRGSTSDPGFRVYGTMVKFHKEAGLSEQQAGIVINNNSSKEDGYYVELVPSKKLDGKAREKRNELIVFSRVNGDSHRIGGKGAMLAIAEDTWYDIDVFITPTGGSDTINVWVNGVNCFTETISGSAKNPIGGKFGLFTRGDTKASFEFLYAIQRNEVQPADDVSFFNLVQGGYTGGMWDREWVHRWKTQTRRKKKPSAKQRRRWNQQFFDEFGPIAHEIREFDVTFEPAPVLHSRVLMTNDWNAICTEYLSTPFGAKFILANAGRENAVINGDDTFTYAGIKHSPTQYLSVIGRALIISEDAKVIAKDESSIQKNGKIESELAERWIQSEDMAKSVANWIRDHWGGGSDGAMVEIFGNPLIEVGDVVTVHYPHRDLYYVKYFVTGTSSTFKNGLSTTLTLRRVT